MIIRFRDKWGECRRGKTEDTQRSLCGDGILGDRRNVSGDRSVTHLLVTATLLGDVALSALGLENLRACTQKGTQHKLGHQVGGQPSQGGCR